jgi:hypothetical protein
MNFENELERQRIAEVEARGKLNEPEPPDVYIDLSGYTTKAGAAKALYEHLRKCAKAEGQDPDIEVIIKNPEEAAAHGVGHCWWVCWEAGPYMWAVGFSLTGLARNFDAGWYTEPHYGCDLCFTE